MKRTTSLLFLLCSLILLATYTVHADDSVYSGDGVDVYPLESAGIQMVAEVITVSDKGGQDRFDVDVDMTFKNHGAQTTVQMGFPILSDWSDGDVIEFDPHFRTWVNGEEVKITKKRGIQNPVKNYPHFLDAVYTYPVTFNQNETIKIKHHYAVGGTIDSIGGWRFMYVLRTGALWKDTINNFKLIYKTKSSSVHEITCTNPPEQTREDHGEETHFVWNFTNYKPGSDFIISGNINRKTTNKTAHLETCVDYYQLAAQPSRTTSQKSLWPALVIWAIIMLLCGLLSYKNAANKNRDKYFWLIVGALTAPLTLLYIYFITKRK